MSKLNITVAIFAGLGLLAVTSGAAAKDQPAGPPPKQYYENGNLLSDVTFEKDGAAVARSYYKNGNVMEEVRFVGREQVRKIRYYPDGTVYYLKQLTGGAVPGEEVFTLYYPDGSIKITGHSWNCEMNGEYKKYYPDGDLLETYYFKNNLMVDQSGKPVTGVLTYHFKNGRILESDSYKDGIPDGPIRTYHPDGYLQIETIYHKHYVMSDRIFDRDGNVLYEKVNK